MAYLELFLMFFRIGLFTVGGGYAMIPLIKQELGGRFGVDEITGIIAIAEMAPGPFGVNAAAFTGMTLHGVLGAVAAVLGLAAPSLVIVTLAALFFFHINKKPAAQAVLGGVRPVVWALILFATYLVARTAFFSSAEFSVSSVDIISIAVFAGAFVCMRVFKKISPVAFIAAAGLFGAFFM